ncbi:MAG: cytochrome c [Armatimonadetes bacterium]|nr:cytochrome c [Armatimonadota bacterium]
MRLLRWAAVGFAAITVVGCNTDMWVQNKTMPHSESSFFADGSGQRPLVPGTIPRGYLREDGAFYTGIENGKWVDKIPLAVTKELIDRGHDRFDIYCTPCHGRLGDGQGMIAQRGFQLQRPVGNYHTDRLRAMPVGHFYDVITNGYGAMYSYASRVEPQDRWAIVAYIRVLQLAHHAPVSELNDNDKAELNKKTDATPETHAEGESH